MIRRNQPLKVKLLIYAFCIFIYLHLSWCYILVIPLMLERSFHLSSFTDSGVQRNRDAGRWNRKGERGGGREEEAEKIINHSHDCVAPLLVLFIRADTLGSGPHCTLLLLSSIKSTVPQSSAEPTVSVNMFLFQEILLKIKVIASGLEVSSGLGVTKHVLVGPGQFSPLLRILWECALTDVS